jgi:hypothetical protein
MEPAKSSKQSSGHNPPAAKYFKRFAPICNMLKDKRGWGNDIYSVKQGYSQLLSQVDLPPKDKIWNSLWNNDSPPKVNSFCWLVAHGKLLTGENLLKRNIHGPFRCELCRNAMETSQHIFLLCPFAISVWKTTLQSLHNKIRWSSQPRESSSQIGFPFIGAPSRINRSSKTYSKPYLSTFAGNFGSPEIESSSPTFALPLL